MADQALLVAQEPAGQPEELDGHDGHRQGGLVRMLGRLRDQPGRRAEETDVRRDGARAEERRRDHAARRRTGQARVRPTGASSTDPFAVRIGGGHDATAVLHRRSQSDHPVAHGQEGGPVGRHHHRATDHEPPHGGQHALLGRAVEIGGGLVEEQEGRVPQERPRQGNPLPLPRRQPGALGAQHGREPLGSPATTSSRPASADGGPNFVIGGVGTAEAHVVGNGAGEEVGTLRDPGHPGPPRIGVEVGQIDSADA